MLKFANFQITSSTLVDSPSAKVEALRATASRAVFDYEPREGYLYVRSRAISSRCNDNFDEFPAEEIARGYKTFIGKPVFVNHHNEDHRRARGFIIDAALHRDTNPDGSPDTWAEVLMEVDAKRFPVLAKAILDRHIERTSMGVDVDYSICSVCSNKATSPANYCQHIPTQKGSRVYRHTASGRRVGVLVREACFGLHFFENSLLVEDPADPTAFVLGVEQGGRHTASKSSEHVPEEVRDALRAEGSLPPIPVFTIRTTSRRIEPEQPHQASTQVLGMGELMEMMREAAGGARPGDWSALPTKTVVGNDGKSRTVKDWANRPDHLKDIKDPSQGRGRVYIHPDIPREHMTDKELAQERGDDAKAKKFMDNRAVRPQHIIDHFNKATPEEFRNGMTWYEDAHHMAKGVSADTGVPMHKVAGLVANYSPQTHWGDNMRAASVVARANKGVGGSGSGYFASHGQRRAADKILHEADHWSDVLKGRKINAFGHLIEHGGNKDDNDPQVCVDRHAMSVALNHRVTDREYAQSGIKNKGTYEKYSNAYREAARRISNSKPFKDAGVKVQPHHVQAITWLVRQRLNGDNDERTKNNGKQSQQQWRDYAAEHHPSLVDSVPGTGYHPSTPDEIQYHRDLKHEKQTGGDSEELRQQYLKEQAAQKGKRQQRSAGFFHQAFGEMKAPPDIDTLRDDTCPVCGADSDTYDGMECQVCGYEQPPAMFRDPDLEKARQIDLRKNTMEPGAVSPEQISPDGQFEPSVAQPGGAADNVMNQQMLMLQQGQPLTPDMLDDSGSPQGQFDNAPQAELDAGEARIPQPGDPFTQGPNAPTPAQPGQPMDQVSPFALDEDGELIGPDGSQGLQPAEGENPGGAEMGQVGTPSDGVPDLMCPNCGFAEDAAQPTTQSMDDKFGPNPEGGQAGDVCPNCGEAPLMTPNDLQQLQQQPAPVAG